MNLVEDRLRAAARAAADTIAPGSAPPLRLEQGARRPLPGRYRWPDRGRATRLIAPLAAAAAVVAVAGVAVHLGSGTQPGRPRSLATPRQFNPLIPFADFGWLPPGSEAHPGGVVAGQMWRSAEQLTAGPDTTLSVFAAGLCAWTRQHPVTEQILTCAPPGAAPGEAEVIRVTSRAPDVNRRPAYWGVGGPLASGDVTNQPVLPMIAIQYAPGGWALLQYPLRKYALRMARTVRFGLRAPVRFGAQLRDGLPQWRISFVSFTQDLSAIAKFDREFSVDRHAAEGFEGDSLIIGDGGQPSDLIQSGSPWLLVFRQPRRLASSCPFNAARTPSQVINGYRVAVRTARGVPPTGGPPGRYQDVCTPDAGGLFVEVAVTGSHPPLTAVQVFGRLKLLGPDPARWTTKPLR